MPGPWEKYAASTPVAPVQGPWSKYAGSMAAGGSDASMDALKEEPILRGAMTAAKTALPIDAMERLADVAQHRTPPSWSNLGDVAQGALALAPATGALGGLGTAARAMGAAGATAGGLEAMGVKNPILRGGIPFAAGLLAGNVNNPQTALQAVSRGDEANAVARLAQQMGIPVEEVARRGLFGRTSPHPQDIAAAWEKAVGGLGQTVGETKAPALSTNASTRQILQRMAQIPGQMTAPGVLNGPAGPISALSNNPGAVDVVTNRLAQAVNAVKANRLPPSQAMEGLNNALEGLKATIAQSGKYGENMAGAAAGAGTGGWQEALNSLAANPEALTQHNAANLQYRKGLALQDLMQNAIGGKAMEGPGFNPRNYAYGAATAGTRPGTADLSALDAKDLAALRKMTEARPGPVGQVRQAISDLKKDLHAEPLRFHPTARLYEEAPTYLMNQNALAPAAAGYRSATYDPSQDPDVQRAQAALRALRLSQVH